MFSLPEDGLFGFDIAVSPRMSQVMLGQPHECCPRDANRGGIIT